jgi:hypothetical protein
VSCSRSLSSVTASWGRSSPTLSSRSSSACLLRIVTPARVGNLEGRRRFRQASLCRYRRKRAVACSSPRNGSDGRPLSTVSSPQGDARPSGKMKFGHAEDRNDVVPTKTARYRGGGYWSAAPLLRRCPALCQPPVDVRRGCQAYSADSRKIETKPAKQVESQRLI